MTIIELMNELQKLLDNGMLENTPVVCSHLTEKNGKFKEKIDSATEVSYTLKPGTTRYESVVICY